MCCVRPGVFDANARRLCCASALIAVDLPALLRPTNAISGKPGLWQLVHSARGDEKTRRVCPRERGLGRRMHRESGGVMGHCKIRGFVSVEPTLRTKVDRHEVAHCSVAGRLVGVAGRSPPSPRRPPNPIWPRGRPSPLRCAAPATRPTVRAAARPIRSSRASTPNTWPSNWTSSSPASATTRS